MIIFGTRSVTMSGESGEFTCPGCGSSRQVYKRKKVRRFFTLYFLPVIPLDKVGEYIECQRCRGTYNEQVLSFDPAAEQAKMQAEFLEHLKRIMILTAAAAGGVDDAEREVIREIHRQNTGVTLSDQEFGRELSQALQAGISPTEYSRCFASSLNEHGKELVIKSVHSVLAAGGELGQDEHALLSNLAAEMNVSGAHLRGILSDLKELES